MLYRIYSLQNRNFGSINQFMNVTTEQLDDLAVVRSNTQGINSSLSTVVNTLRNSAGTAIQALQAAQSSLSNISDNAFSLPNVSTQSSNIANRLTYSTGGSTYSAAYSLYHILQSARNIDSDTNNLATLPTISESLGLVASRLLANGSSAASWLSQVFNRLGYTDDSGSVFTLGYSTYSILDYLRDSGLSGVADDLSLVASRLLANGSSAASWLSQVFNRLGYTTGDGTVFSAGYSLYQLLQAVRGLDIGGVIDGIETGSTSIVQRLAQLPGVLQDGFSSVVEGLGNVAVTFPDSITATLSGDATISAETDVAGEAAQSGTLWDAIVGDVDLPQIRAQMDATVGILRTSFPFGCIFVLSDALSALSAAPVAPVFECDLPAVSGTYHAVIDLSFFDSMAALWRGGMVVIYVAGLYSATKHWVFNGGGESA